MKIAEFWNRIAFARFKDQARKKCGHRKLVKILHRLIKVHFSHIEFVSKNGGGKLAFSRKGLFFKIAHFAQHREPALDKAESARAHFFPGLKVMKSFWINIQQL